MLQKGKIVPYPTSVNINVLLVFEGDLSLASALKAAHHSYKLTTWGFRFIGFVLLFFAITCTTALLQVLCKHLYYDLIELVSNVFDYDQ